MASNSGRRSGSSGRSTRRRVVIGAEETVRVRYKKNEPEVESERRTARGARPDKVSRSAKQSSSQAGKRLQSAKRQERERRQRDIRVRRVALMGALVAALVLAGWGLIALWQAPLFAIETVEVAGAEHHARSEVLSIAAVPTDATLLRLPRREITQRLLADPWIADADIDRDFPATLRISIVERRPVAIVDGGGTRLWVVSGDGYWLGPRSAEETGLVAVRDVGEVHPEAGVRVAEPQIANAVRVIAGLSQELRRDVASVSAPSVEETAFRTRDDVEVFIGEATQMEEKDRIVREILARQEGVVYINVRVVDRPTWRGLEEEAE